MRAADIRTHYSAEPLHARHALHAVQHKHEKWGSTASNAVQYLWVYMFLCVGGGDAAASAVQVHSHTRGGRAHRVRGGPAAPGPPGQVSPGLPVRGHTGIYTSHDGHLCMDWCVRCVVCVCLVV